MRRWILGSAILPLLAVSIVPAAELAGVEMPDTVSVDGRELVLNGMGLREKLWIDVYVAGLYLEHESSDADEILASEQIKRLKMHFVYKKVGTKKLTDAWTEGFEANAGDVAERLHSELDRLNGWMEDMLKGDEMTFTSVPGRGLEVSVKGTSKGVIEGDFSTAFWKIFLGPKPPTEKLKNGLLGAE